MELAGDGLSHADPERDELLSLIGSQVGQFLERNRVEEERERLLARLTQADRLKDEFLAMLSHELRNPLAAIGTAVELLDMAFDDPDQRSWAMEVVERQVQNLTHLMDDLLDVSRVTRGKILLKKRVVDASEIVRQAVETVGEFLDDREHALELSLDPGLWVEADPTRLEQIIVNLLTNAVKYTESGGLIRVEAFREDRDVVCIVRDSGGDPAGQAELDLRALRPG